MTGKYYRIARKSSLRIGRHPGLIYLRSLCREAIKVLDVGCGEGSRLNLLLPGKSGLGVDPSRQALKMAVRQYPRHRFLLGTGEQLPLANNSFDLIYTAFAIEHCQNPEVFISEMVRVCRPGGRLVILCPNYGAPNRRSPVSVQNPVTKLACSLVADFIPRSGLHWQPVTPQKIYRHIDDDTTFEPYLLSLARYLKSCPVIVEKQSSLWEIEPERNEAPQSDDRGIFSRLLRLPTGKAGRERNPSEAETSSHSSPSLRSRFSAKGDKLYKYLFYRLGIWGVFPFKYWGPQIFVCARKI